jgi:drug/metabolite transporter (DMT)-like permease
VGDVLVAKAMQRIGDLGDLRREHGVAAVILRVATSGVLFGGIFFMAIAFFSNLIGLSWADLSLVGPTSAALTFIGNAIGAKYFLNERVDRRRWFATIFVSFGVLLLTRS